MTTSSTASKTSDVVERLRATIRAEDYEQVLKVLPEYHRWFEQAFHEASGDPEETRRLALEARDLLTWARSTVTATRAHDQAKLGRLDNAVRYLPTREGASQSWRVEA
jgi:hypothetical protein